MKQYELFELEFRGLEPAGSSVDIDLKAEFDIDRRVTIVSGFYAGSGVYKIRFLPLESGRYKWTVLGLFTTEGEEYCEESDSGGIVRADSTHFKYSSGNNYYPFGTTVYALIHQKKDLVDTTMKTLASSPFNKLRFCIFPKYMVFNNNKPDLFAFEKKKESWDMERPCFEFWDMLEDRIVELNDLGIQGDLILFHPYDCWGFSKLKKDQCFTYLDYAMRRLSAFPNLWWSLANEFDTMPNFDISWWSEFASFIAEQDPYGHLISNHNCLVYWDFHNENTSHCCIQDSSLTGVPDYLREYKKPVIIDECGYEGSVPYAWGNLSAFEMVNSFWTVVTYGGYCTHGETFMNPEELLWWSKGGILKGESPERIAFLKRLVENFPGPIDFYPDSEQDIEGLIQLKTHPERVGEIKGFAPKLHMQPYERIVSFVNEVRMCQGHCGDDLFLQYYQRHCAAEGHLLLPERFQYSIEIIDVWEMTITPLKGVFSGKSIIPLPGKEGIAVLAKKKQ